MSSLIHSISKLIMKLRRTRPPSELEGVLPDDCPYVKADRVDDAPVFLTHVGGQRYVVNTGGKRKLCL